MKHTWLWFVTKAYSLAQWRNDPSPRFGPRLISWESPLTDQPETPCPWKPPQRRREGWLEGCCEWGDVTAPAPESLLQRQSERGERLRKRENRGEEKGSKGEAAAAAAAAASAGGSLDFAPTRSCANSSPACHASVRGVVRNVHSCGERKEDWEKMEKCLLHQMWTQTAVASDCIRNA